MKVITTAHALRLLGNSIRGMHQVHTRQIYIGAIQPITTYGLASFWKFKNGGGINELSPPKFIVKTDPDATDVDNPA